MKYDIQQCADTIKAIIGIPESVAIDCYYDETLENGITGKAFMSSRQDYMILVKPDRPEIDIIETIAHELIHVRQFYQEEISYPLDTSIPYHQRPWEIEAYSLQGAIAQQFMRNING